MRKTMMMLIGTMLATPVLAEPPQERRETREGVWRERREVRESAREVEQGRREVRRAMEQGDHREAREEMRELKRDQAELKRDRADLRRAQREAVRDLNEWRDDHRREWRRDWRNDRRYDWRHWRNEHREHYRAPRYAAPRYHNYHRWSIGIRVDPWFYGNRYWISDPWQYRLPPAYGPYRWVRYYDDVMLVDTRTGRIVDIIYDFFW